MTAKDGYEEMAKLVINRWADLSSIDSMDFEEVEILEAEIKRGFRQVAKQERERIALDLKSLSESYKDKPDRNESVAILSLAAWHVRRLEEEGK